MKARVVLFKNDGAGKRGYPVKLIVTHRGKVKRKTIGYSTADLWDNLHEGPTPSHPDYENIFGLIFKVRQASITSEFLSLTDLDSALLYLYGNSGATEISVYDYLEKCVEEMRKAGRDGNADAYLFAMRQFKRYAPTLRFSDITPQWIEGFKKYKLRTCTDKTVKNYLGVLRAVYNNASLDAAVRFEDTRPFRNMMRGLVVPGGRKKNRYLDRSQLRVLRDNFESGNLSKVERRVVGLSLLQFYFGGANLKDIYFLKRVQFYDDRVMLMRMKLGRKGREYDLKVFPCATRVIMELGSESGDFVFPWGKSHLQYKTFSRNHYRSLQLLKQKLGIVISPIDDRFGSNVFRHSFATLAKYSGVDPDIIRELMGHERNDIDTLYKDRYPEDVRDTAHREIINLDS